MTKCNKQYIVVKSQYVLHILQYIAIHFWHIVIALTFREIPRFNRTSPFPFLDRDSPRSPFYGVYSFYMYVLMLVTSTTETIF